MLRNRSAVKSSLNKHWYRALHHSAIEATLVAKPWSIMTAATRFLCYCTVANLGHNVCRCWLHWLTISAAVNCWKCKDTQQTMLCQWLIVFQEDNGYLPECKIGPTVLLALALPHVAQLWGVTRWFDAPAVFEINIKSPASIDLTEVVK
jgi:hypothetical protein